MSPDHYQAAHIPGAIFWNIMTDLLLPDLRQNLDIYHIERLLSRSGITNETTVVAYGSYPGTGAWIFWCSTFYERGLTMGNPIREGTVCTHRALPKLFLWFSDRFLEPQTKAHYFRQVCRRMDWPFCDTRNSANPLGNLGEFQASSST
ncbi:rhodanese-like domain-containing protein [Leptolyngbya sp. PL-A3]|nr:MULTISPECIES: rhodanese-like domain-containing protein [unclassified Leptolyngbya]